MAWLFIHRYTARGIVRSFIAVNVPYMLPVEAFGLDFYKVCERAVSILESVHID
jgi:hypothetical protein